jgi:hypothetical protein
MPSTARHCCNWSTNLARFASTCFRRSEARCRGLSHWTMKQASSMWSPSKTWSPEPLRWSAVACDGDRASTSSMRRPSRACPGSVGRSNWRRHGTTTANRCPERSTRPHVRPLGYLRPIPSWLSSRRTPATLRPANAVASTGPSGRRRRTESSRSLATVRAQRGSLLRSPPQYGQSLPSGLEGLYRSRTVPVSRPLLSPEIFRTDARLAGGRFQRHTIPDSETAGGRTSARILRSRGGEFEGRSADQTRGSAATEPDERSAPARASEAVGESEGRALRIILVPLRGFEPRSRG